MIDKEEKLKVFKEKVGTEFSDYYCENFDELLRYTDKWIKDIKASEAVLQYSFSISLDKIESYNSDMETFKTWLSAINKSECISFISFIKDRRKNNITEDLIYEDRGYEWELRRKMEKRQSSILMKY